MDVAKIVGTFYYDSYCVNPTLKGGDYILYSGTKADAPVKVSAIVVPANATSGSTFGGACYGNGAGVTYIVRQ